MHEETLIVPTKVVAAYLLLTPHRVRQLVGEGILKHAERNRRVLKGRFRLLEAVNAYVRYARAKAAGVVMDAEYSAARTRRANAMAAMAELELKAKEGKYLYRDDVEYFWTQSITRSKQKLLAIPSRVMHQLVGLTDARKANQIVTDEIHGALRELSEYKPDEAEMNRYLETLVIDT
jgi:phage terminase Nu1 subunit (DNA packaging protein)